MLKIQTTAGRIAAAYTAAAKDGPRYYLKGVLFERRGASGLSIVATDGHRMVVVKSEADRFDSDDKVDRVIIALDAETLAEFRKVKMRETAVTIGVDGAEAEAAYAGTTRKVKVVDGQYPVWQRIVPLVGGETQAGGFNSDHVADVAKAAKLLTGRAGARIKVDPRGTGAGRFDIVCDGGDEAFAIVMPVASEP